MSINQKVNDLYNGEDYFGRTYKSISMTVVLQMFVNNS